MNVDGAYLSRAYVMADARQDMQLKIEGAETECRSRDRTVYVHILDGGGEVSRPVEVSVELLRNVLSTFLDG